MAPDNSEVWEREISAITYEPSAPDDELQSLPVERLALLRVSRAMNREASQMFYGQRFRFLEPREIIQVDHGVYHGILALEAFFADRPTAASRNQFSEIELDLRPVQHPDRVDNEIDYVGRNVTMREFGTNTRLNWTDGLDRLPMVADILRPMPFQHLHLHFEDNAPWWYDFRITVSGQMFFINHQNLPTTI